MKIHRRNAWAGAIYIGLAALGGAIVGYEPQASAGGPITPASPGQQIVFARGGREICAMLADGSQQQRVLRTDLLVESPDWSPDGTKIAFTGANSEANASDIYEMNFDGTGLTQLTFSAESESEPDWSPDGAMIAFTRTTYEPYDSDIYVMESDGSNQINLTNHERKDRGAAWSADGSAIAFSRETPAGFDSVDIYVMDSDGTNQRALTSGGWQPAWGPNPTRIAFVRFSGSDSGSGGRRYAPGRPAPFITPLPPAWQEIHVMNADGGGDTRLTFNETEDVTPSWAPDGARIAFTRWEPDYDREIYVMNADGGEPTNVSENSFFAESAPDWRPVAPSDEDGLPPSTVTPRCGVVDSEISIFYDQTRRRFGGSVLPQQASQAAWQFCREARAVILLKKRPGRDRLLGRDLTDPHGQWTVRMESRPERAVYAKVRPKEVPDIRCRRARSDTANR